MKTDKPFDILKSGFCQQGGLGHGSDQCKCRVTQTEKRVLTGGPDIQAELDKAGTPSEPGLSLLVPDSVNSLEKLSAFIITSGYQRGTPEYMELYSKYRTGLKSESPYL